MTGASLLIGAALAVATTAYLVRPFRAARHESLSRSLERWVAAARQQPPGPFAPPSSTEGEARFCRHCGRPLVSDSRFCSGCGTPVEGPRP